MIIRHWSQCVTVIHRALAPLPAIPVLRPYVRLNVLQLRAALIFRYPRCRFSRISPATSYRRTFPCPSFLPDAMLQLTLSP